MPDLQSILTQRFQAAVVKAFGQDHAHTDPLVRPSGNPQFGDYQANVAMSLAKKLGVKPRDAAQKIIDHLDAADLLAKKPEIAGPGFINVHLADAFLAARAKLQASDPRLGVTPAAAPETVVIDYSGPNVAKEMHVGHLRSTVIGDALARTLAFLGHNVVRQNHLGDWGTQFGMLIERLVLDHNHTGDGVPTFADLGAFYRDAKARFDADADFAGRSRARVVRLQGGDPQTLSYWRQLVLASQVHFRKIYARLGVLLADADIRGESFYNDKLAPVASELEHIGIARISDGALCVFPEGFKGPEGNPVPLIVRKSDGGYGYDTTDLAALRFRVFDLHATRLIYVTDARQKQHFAMVFKAAEMARWLKAHARAEHVPFGTVLGHDGKPFKTRSGDTVKLADLLDEAVARAASVIEKKNPDIAGDERANVAEAIGIGAVKYADLVNDRIKDYVFDFDRMLAFDGNTAPYLVNAYVRIRSIARKAQRENVSLGGPGATVTLAEPAERALALKLLQFPNAVESVGASLEPHRLCGYLHELAALYHQFYEHCPILSAPDATRHSRWALCDLAGNTLKQGLELLGIRTVEQM